MNAVSETSSSLRGQGQTRSELKSTQKAIPQFNFLWCSFRNNEGQKSNLCIKPAKDYFCKVSTMLAQPFRQRCH